MSARQSLNRSRDPGRENALWFKRGGAYSRNTMLKILFFESSEPNTDDVGSSSSSNTKKSSYTNWFLNFKEPAYDKRNNTFYTRQLPEFVWTGNKKQYINISKDEAYRKNLEKQAFTLYAEVLSDDDDDDEDDDYYLKQMNQNRYGLKKQTGAFFIIPQSNTPAHMDITSDHFVTGIWLFLNSCHKNFNVIDLEPVKVVEIAPAILHRYFPLPPYKLTKNHPVADNEARILKGNYKGMIQHVSTHHKNLLKAKKERQYKKRQDKKKTKQRDKVIERTKVQNLKLTTFYRHKMYTTGSFTARWE